MEHKLDDFFRKKIENIEDTLPENSVFDEQLFWGELQKKRNTPRTKDWWKWIAIAACIGGLVIWIVVISTITPEVPKTTHIPKVEPAKEEQNTVAIVVTHKTKVKTHKLKKQEEVQPKKELKIEVEQLAVKVSPIPTQAPIIKKDSIYFKPATMAELKPQFKTIHVNEISNTETSPIPQPKFKIRFAARNQH